MKKLLTLIALITLSTLAYAQLSGTYSIGGSSPDYANLSSAVADLNTNGISGPVTLSLRDGIYNEQVSLEEIVGASSSNTITITSESGDSSTVTLQFNNTSSSNYIIRLDGADYVNIQDIHLQGLNTSYSDLIVFQGGASNNKVENCYLQGDFNSGRLIYSNVDTDENNRFANNHFYQGAYGIYYRGGNTNSLESGTSIENNQLEAQYYDAIYTAFQDSILIRNNEIYGMATNGSAAIYCYYCDNGFEITSNKITSDYKYYGINLYQCDASMTSPALIANNVISLGYSGNGNTYGIYQYYSNYLHIYYNSVAVNATGTTSSAFYNYAGNNIDFRNNSFANFGSRYSIYNTSPTNITNGNNNNLYTTGSTLAYANGDMPTLADWETATGTSVNKNVNPLYASSSDLSPNHAYLDGGATPLAAVNTDINGNARNTPPDIGAYEFTTTGDNAALQAINYPLAPFSPGSHLLRATLENAGSNPLTSADIHWEINGIAQGTVNWTGSLTEAESLEIDLGNYNFNPITRYDLKVWVANPNGNTDTDASDDTLTVQRIYTMFNGTYTIGGPNPDFDGFANVGEALNYGGLDGAVTFNFRDGIYEEQVSLGEIYNNDATNTITFQSESADSSLVTIQFNSPNNSNYLLRLLGTDYVTLRNLSFKGLGTSYSDLVVFEDGANNLTIENCSFEGDTNSGRLIYSAADQDNNTVIRNNYFWKGYDAINLRGGNTTTLEAGTLIENNEFVDTYYQNIYAYFHDEIIVRNNIANSSNDAAGAYKFYLRNCDNAIQITNNQIISESGYYGLALSNCDATIGGEGLIANNFISLKNTGNVTVHGIYQYYATNQQFYHNSVQVHSSNPTGGRAYYNVYGSNIDLKNNIFANLGTGYAIYAISTSAILSSDHNAFYTNGNTLGYWQGVTPTLADWQAASGRDANSVTTDPLFAGTDDYHVNAALLNGGGTTLAAVTTDLDGEPRDTPPDIGVDEFTPVGENAGITALDFPSAPFDPGSYPLTVTLLNSAVADLTSADLHWAINGVAQSTINWTGTLGTSATMQVALGTYNFEPLTRYDIRAWVANPNGGTDIDASNDTLFFENIYTTIGGTYTIGGASPDFPSFSEAADAMTYGGLSASVLFNVRDGIYAEQFSLGEILNNDVTKTINFGSESADSSAVTLQFNSSSQQNYLVELLGTDFVSFKNIGFKTLNTSYANVIVFKNGADNLLVENCHFEGDVNSGYHILSNSSSDHNTVIRNNYFYQSAAGIYLRGASNSNQENGTIVEHNVFRNTAAESMLIQYQNAPTISYNDISATADNTGGYKMRLNNCDNGLTCIGNKVISSNSYYGLSLESCNSIAGNEGLVANNFVSLKYGSSTSYGLYRNGGSYLNIYYNSVQIQSNHVTAGCSYYGYYGNNIRLKNNIFSNIGGGYAIYEAINSALIESDHNNYYTTGNDLGYFGSTSITTTLGDWQTATSMDANSLNLNPLFTSEDDLHISLIALQAATPIAGILEDIDGDNRNPVTPYIGADETPTASDDAGLVSIDAPTMPFPAGNNDIYVTLVNNFAADLNSVNFHWEVNGSPQADFAWAGSVSSGGQQSINIGSHLFEIATPYDIKVWISNPNGIVDIFAVNDTVGVENLYAALSGVYTIGDVGSDFADFTAAAAALQNSGVVGPVTFQVAAGTYDEQFALSQIMGSSANNRIIFESATGDNSEVVLTHSSTYDNNYIVSLNDAQYITFRNMTFEATATSYARVFHVTGSSESLHLEGNIISGGNTSGSNGDLVYAYYVNMSNFVAVGNSFLNGSTALQLIVNGDLAAGTVIDNNTFTNQYYYGIYLNRHDGPKIRGNKITTTGTSTGYDAMYLISVDNELEISKNKISIDAGRSGIQITTCDGVAGSSQLIANNFITLGGTSNTYGIYSNNNTHQKYYFNSINLTSSEASSGRAFYLNGGGNIHLLNNILANTGGGYALYVNTTSAIPVSDHNNLYSDGGVLGYWNGNRSSLASWQAASNLDGNSISVDPLFAAADDLHVTQQNLSEAGTPVAEISDDIDSEQRNPLNPDIGADEFTNLQNNLALEALLNPESGCDLPAADSVVIVIRNQGSDPQTAFNVAYQIDSNTPVVENVGSLNIAGGDAAEYVFSTPINFSVDSSYTLRAYTLLATDELNENDSISVTINSYPTQAAVIVTPNLDLCEGTGINLQASGGSSYSWSNGANNSSTYVSPTSTTTYFVDVTNENGCTETGQVTVTVLPKPAIPTISYTGNTICAGDSLELTSSITDNITWTTGDTTASIFVKTSGGYRVTHTSADGCEAVSSNTYISVLNEPSISAFPFASVCEGESVTLTLQYGSTYTWSTGEMTQVITVAPTDTTVYYVNGTNSAGCVYSDSIQVNILPAVSPGSISNHLPADGSFELDLPITFSWSPAPNASHYDVFIWEEGTTKPTSPAINNTSNISYNYSNLSYGKTYNWQVVAENSCSQTLGDTLLFSVRHLPDLLVSEIQIPEDIASGGDLQISWKVKNQGLGSTLDDTWRDRIFLSIDQVQGNADDIELAYFDNLNYLNEGQEYQQMRNITLPEDAIGYFYLYVKTDVWNYVKEVDNNNNFLEDTLLVFPAPLPDLRMYSIGGPNIAFGKDTISITYTVKNEGTRALSGEAWRDAIFLLRDSSEVVTPLDIQLGPTQELNITLEPDSTYTRTVTGAIPHTAFGDYYVIGFTDRFDQIEEYTRESNNFGLRDNLLEVVLRPPADLTVSDHIIPATATSGQPVNLGWEVSNEGANPPCESYWVDRYYISKLDTFNWDSIIYMGKSYTYSGDTLDYTEKYSKMITHTLPNGLSGYYYLYVNTDYGDRVFEHIAEHNNIGRSTGTFLINLAPYPDLTTTSIMIPDTVVGGYPFLNEYVVENIGTAASTTTLNDYWSLGSGNGFISNLFITDDIPAGGSITVSAMMAASVATLEGTYDLRVKNDRFDAIYEYGQKANNTASQPIFIREPISDLTPTALTVPAIIQAGVKFDVTSSVQNIGPEFTDEKNWNDGLFLSTDNILDASDLRIKGRSRSTALAAGQSYSLLMTDIEITEAYTGNYYLIYFADEGGRLDKETDVSNNYYTQAINVLPAPDVDLVPESMVYPATIYAGQQIALSYTVSNQGTEDPIIFPWYDDVIVSATPDLTSGTQRVLKRSARSTVVMAGDSYTVNTLVTIPPYYVGNYYFVIKSDIYDYVYEYNNEGNNLLAELIEILPPPETDLLLTTVDIPASITPGNEITINYTVKNDGSEPAVGLLRDALHVSTDGAFDGVADPFIGLQDRNVVLLPGDSLVSTFTTEFPGVLPGTYSGIGRTNTLNQIPEIDLTNNDKVSNNTIDVLIPSLTLDVVEPNITLAFEDNIYYQVNVAADLDLLVTLTSNQFEGINEVYIAYGRVPTPNDFDYQFLNTNEVNQEVLVPQTQAGTYYILVRCLSNHLGQQRVDLLAEALPFSIVSIQSNVVGQGRVTCLLNGAGFRDSTIITLENGMGMVMDTASIRNFTSSMQLRIRWELAAVPLGLYDVVATNTNGDRVVLVEGLTVEELYREVGYDVVGPEVVRAGTANPYSVVFENIGNVDVDYFAAQVVTVNVPFYFIETFGQLTKTTDVHPVGEDIIYNEDVLGSGLTAHIGPLLGREITPGQIYQANIQVGGFTVPEFTLSVGVESFTTEEFLVRHDQTLMAVYDDIIANPGNYDPAVVGLAASGYSDLHDFYVQWLVDYDLLEQAASGLASNLSGGPINNRLFHEIANGQRRMQQSTACDIGGFAAGTATFSTCAAITLAASITGPGAVAIGFTCFALNYWVIIPNYKDWCNDVIAGGDPNEIAGPVGYGTEQWVAAEEQMNYTIFFENDPALATAATQRVNVTQQLDPNVDPYSFRLSGFGFAGMTFDVPPNRLTYTQLLDLPDSLSYDVQLTAGLNVNDNTIFWEFQTIDPNTGLPPADPYIGFLPINDSTGIGEGYVYYSILPANSVVTGDSIQAEATIVFGVNEEIKTNVWTNYIDAVAPTTAVAPLAATVVDPNILIQFNGADDAGGVGIDYYQLYVSEDGAPYQLVADSIYNTGYSFTGMLGSYYDFYSLGVDYVGNVAPQKIVPDAFTTIGRDQSLDLRIYLEDAFVNTNEMSLGLNTNGYLPLAQPYGAAPWSYVGNEALSTIPADMVDWVLVTIRSDVDAASSLDTLAGILRSDGQIVGTDGLNLVLDRDLGTLDSLYITVLHRNHLGVMTAMKQGAENAIFSYDFTTMEAYGTAAMRILGTGEFALFGGDANSDSQVDASDRSATWNGRNQSGYLNTDVTLDGNVDASDRSRTWNNRNKAMQIP